MSKMAKNLLLLQKWVSFPWVFLPKFWVDSTTLSFLPGIGLEFFSGRPWVFWKCSKNKPVLHTPNLNFRTQIHVFSFPNRCKKLYTITTRENPRGLCEVTPMRMSSHVGGDESAAGGEFMVFPGYKTGSMQIVNMATTEQRVSSAPVTINAHQSELCCLAINQQVKRALSWTSISSL